MASEAVSCLHFHVSAHQVAAAVLQLLRTCLQCQSSAVASSHQQRDDTFLQGYAAVSWCRFILPRSGHAKRPDACASTVYRYIRLALPSYLCRGRIAVGILCSSTETTLAETRRCSSVGLLYLVLAIRLPASMCRDGVRVDSMRPEFDKHGVPSSTLSFFSIVTVLFIRSILRLRRPRHFLAPSEREMYPQAVFMTLCTALRLFLILDAVQSSNMRLTASQPNRGRDDAEEEQDQPWTQRGTSSGSARWKNLKSSANYVAKDDNSIFCLGKDNRFRIACVRLVSNPWFDRFILCLILINSIILAMTDWTVINEDPDSEYLGQPSTEGSWRNAMVYRSEVIFIAIFTIEMAIKVVATGFCRGRKAYLRDPWNVLDFLVVVTGLLTAIPGMPRMNAIRVFRVLRPLRSVSILPGLQKLVIGMLRSVPQLVSVVVLLMFIFTVFGIFGIQIFAGKQHSRCRLTPYPVTIDFEVRRLWCKCCRIHCNMLVCKDSVSD